MTKGRLEAFSDGVLAIIITIMVLELRPPDPINGTGFAALGPLVPKFIAYALSFVNVGSYWNNHHHLLHASRVVNGRVLWANLFLLFWLSLFPFVTAWMGDAGYSQDSVALYGVIALLAGAAYSLLLLELRRVPGQSGPVMETDGAGLKGFVSLGLYAAGAIIALAGFPFIAFAGYVIVAIMWFIPDRRVEQTLHHGG